MLLPTQIILLVALNHLEHHKANSSTPNTYGTNPDLTNLIALRCFNAIYSTGRSEYEL